MIKLISMEENFEERLIFEKVFDKLENEHIIKIRDSNMVEDKWWMAMEYFPLGSVGDFIRNNGPLSEDQIFQIIKQLSQAFQYFAHHDILHRNLNCDVIFISQSDDTQIYKIGGIDRAIEEAKENPQEHSPFKIDAFTPPEFHKVYFCVSFSYIFKEKIRKKWRFMVFRFNYLFYDNWRNSNGFKC